MIEGPLGKKTAARWAKIGNTAVIEMARASGLALVKGKNRIMEATSAGTGQLIRAALDRGCKKILIGVGGTACSEGGAGALMALGLRYYDKNRKILSARPVDLLKLDAVDWTHFDRRIGKTEVRVLCDVTNPLLGKNGSARTFGPQKGATPSQVRALEKMLAQWSRFAKHKVANKPGTGAAGALAFGLAGFAGAKLVPGTMAVMNALDWEQAAGEADIIFTGEGRLDKTSFQGKVIGEIARRKKKAKVVAVCGSSALSEKEAKELGLDAVLTLKEFL